MLLERHPDFKGFETPRQLKTIIVDGFEATCQTPFFLQQIIRSDGKSIAVRLGIFNQGAAYFVGDVKPFVQVKSDTIGFFNGAQCWGVLRIKFGQGTISPIYVEPQLILLANLPEFFKWINCPGIDRTRSAHHTKREMPGGEVSFNAFDQFHGIDFVLGIYRNFANCFGPQSQNFHRFLNTTMGFRRAIQSHLTTNVEQSFLAHTSLMIAGYGEGSNVGHRAAAEQNPRGFGRVVEHLFAPIHHLLIYVERGVFSNRNIGVHRSGQQIGQYAQWGASALHPGEKARMDVALGVRKDVLFELLINAVNVLRFLGDIRGEKTFDFGGDGLPNGLFTDIFQIIHHIVDHLVAQLAHLLPVLGV